MRAGFTIHDGRETGNMSRQQAPAGQDHRHHADGGSCVEHAVHRRFAVISEERSDLL